MNVLSKYRLEFITEQKGVKGGVSHQRTHTHTAAASDFPIPSSSWHVQHRPDMYKHIPLLKMKQRILLICLRALFVKQYQCYDPATVNLYLYILYMFGVNSKHSFFLTDVTKCSNASNNAERLNWVTYFCQLS